MKGGRTSRSSVARKSRVNHTDRREALDNQQTGSDGKIWCTNHTHNYKEFRFTFHPLAPLKSPTALTSCVSANSNWRAAESSGKTTRTIRQMVSSVLYIPEYNVPTVCPKTLNLNYTRVND